ncbi:MAG TPA: hypothetical protein VGZ22_14960 [Isosphaeraceae bacterium]|nr:hypothetical protein [Isosphaeraceae bacterium]
MRTENPMSSASALGQIRTQAARVRRWVRDQPAAARWTFALLALLALVVAGYFSAPSEPIGWTSLYNGYKFSPEEALKVTTELTTNSIEAKVDGQGRIAVAADHVVESLKVLKKKNLEPRSPKDRAREAVEPHILEGPSEREQRQLLAQKEQLERQLEEFEDVTEANVTIFRERARSFNQPPNVKASVFLKARDEGRKIPAATIKKIKYMLGNIPDLKPDAITVLDRDHIYLLAGNPAVGQESEARAREEELSEDLKERLNWIDGIKILVRLEQSVPSLTQLVPKPSSPVTITVNKPLDAEPKPAPGKVRVFIQVPNSYYIETYRRARPGHEPSPEDLMPHIARTKELIRNTVAHVISNEELGPLTIDPINDLGASQQVFTSSPTENHRSLPWWAPAAGGGALTALLALAGGRLLAARRPTNRPVHSNRAEGQRYDVGESSGASPGPAERVRELVRLNPEAAAGVLQRWIGLGGHTP